VSLTNEAEAAVLDHLFLNSNWANVGDATGLLAAGTVGSLYVSLHTADPGETGDQTTSETSVGGYARVAVARSGVGWTRSATAPTQIANTAAVTFPTCTSGSATITHWGIGTASSGAGHLLCSFALTASVAASTGVRPEFAIGALVVTVD
jgi:hypothetical protein